MKRTSLHLVSCVSMKLDRAARAEDIYVSPWFIKARAYVTAIGSSWRILSAKHGLLNPDSIVEPYNATLNTMPIAERRAWAEVVLAALDATIGNGDEVTILAGARYREFLVHALEARGIRVLVPMAGLGVGEQLRWFNEHAARRSRQVHSA